MLSSNEFTGISEFIEKESWSTLTSAEKNLLGLVFVSHGADMLAKGDKDGLDSFHLATQVAGENPIIFYRQAVVFFTLGRNLQCLIGGCKALNIATRLDPNFFDAWQLWGITLTHRGSMLQESIYLEEALQKFDEAKKNSGAATQEQLANLYGQWGMCYHLHGKMSGEACDYHSAFEKYRLAADLGLNHILFWNDYAEAAGELAALIGSLDLLLQAVSFSKKAIEASPDNFEGWFHLGACYQKIYESTREEQYFLSAHEAYTNASEINDKLMQLWLLWGVLLTDAAKDKRNLELFKMSFEKFEKANAIEPDNSELLSRWGESQALCGAFTDRIDYLREAEAKIIRSLEKDPEHVDTWYVYGSCLSEIGRYFEDEHYYRQAIEKLQYGLSLNQKHPMLWHTLALAYFAIGEMRNDVDLLKKSIEHFSKAHECASATIPADFWNDWGVALMKLAELTNDQSAVESAIEKFEKALGKGPLANHNGQVLPDLPVDTVWVYNYACALDCLGAFNEDPREHEKAIQLFSRLLEEDPSAIHVRYNLALALSNYAELTDDIEYFHKSLQQFEVLLENDPEDGMAWNEWGLTLVNLAELIHESTHPEKSQALYEQAEGKFRHAIGLGVNQAFYNLACLYSLVDNFEAAMHFIERAEQAGALPTIDDMLHDAWLDGLRQTQYFRHFLAKKNNAE